MSTQGLSGSYCLLKLTTTCWSSLSLSIPTTIMSCLVGHLHPHLFWVSAFLWIYPSMLVSLEPSHSLDCQQHCCWLSGNITLPTTQHQDLQDWLLSEGLAQGYISLGHPSLCLSAILNYANLWPVSWGLFLKRPSNLTGLKSYFQIKVSRKVGYVHPLMNSI